MNFYVEYFDTESKLRNVCVECSSTFKDEVSSEAKTKAALAIIINDRERDKSKRVSKIRMYRAMHKSPTLIY